MNCGRVLAVGDATATGQCQVTLLGCVLVSEVINQQSFKNSTFAKEVTIQDLRPDRHAV